METALHNLITNKAFEDRQHGLRARFSANHIDYAYKYNEGAVPSITVWLNHGNIPATIVITEDGTLSFTYFENGRNKPQQFKNCTEADFSSMIDYAVNYLVNCNFEVHAAWFEKLEVDK